MCVICMTNFLEINTETLIETTFFSTNTNEPIQERDSAFYVAPKVRLRPKMTSKKYEKDNLASDCKEWLCSAHR